MIAADTSSLRRFLSGERGEDVDAVGEAIAHHSLILPPVVLTEILSDPGLDVSIRDTLTSLPLLEPTEGYWERAGALRSRLIAVGRKAKVADALIAQSCLDHDVELITHDRDFRHYEPHGLSLL